MSIEVKFKKKAKAKLDSLDAQVRERILDKLLSGNFQGFPLTGKLSGYFKLRVGDWRVVYSFVERCFVVHNIGHRSDIYK